MVAIGYSEITDVIIAYCGSNSFDRGIGFTDLLVSFQHPLVTHIFINILVMHVIEKRVQPVFADRKMTGNIFAG